MMKKKIILACMVLVALICFGMFGLVSNYQWQQKVAAEENLKIEFKKSASDSNPSFALAITTQRLDDISAKLKFESTGKFVNSSVEVQPLFITENSIEKEPVAVGEKTTFRQSKQFEVSSPNEWADIEAVFPSDKSVNAVMLKISALNSPTSENITVIVPLTNSPSFSGVKLPTSKTAKTSSAPCTCVEVSGYGATCGLVCGYCGSSNGNTIDLVRCRVTCGTPCVDRQNCPRCE